MKWIIAGIVVLSAAFSGCLMVACGGDLVATDRWSSALYSSQEYGFSIQYPSTFKTLEIPPEKNADAGPLFHVVFADPDGATIAGNSVDTLDVSVYEMNRAPSPAEFKRHKKDFQRMAMELVGKPQSLRIAEPFKWGTYAGEKALQGVYTYQIDGSDVAASATLVFRDARAYLIRAQASRETWGTTGRELVSSVATFAFL